MTMARYSGVVTDDAGNIVPNATIEVRRETPGQPLAALKSDRAGISAISNPFTAEADGTFAFHVVGGAYQIRAYTVSPAFEAPPRRYVPIGLAAESDGVDGVDAGILFSWDTGTTDADPFAGNIRANNASMASATFLYISKTSRGASDVENFLLALDDSTSTVKGTIVLSRPTDESQSTFNVTAVTDATDYVKVAVSNHSGVTAFAATDAIALQFYRTGDKGSSPTTTRGDLITRGASVDQRLGIGSAGSHLQSDGTDAGWAAFLNPGTSAVSRSWNSKAADIVHVADFGAVGNGSTDDTAAFAAAAAALGATGGTVIVGSDKTYLIDNNLTVPTNVTFKGQHNTFGGAFTEGSRIIVNSAKTITLGHTSGFSGCYFVRKGMAGPENDASAYAGTLFTGTGNDISIRDLLVIGFNKLFVSSGVGRFMADHIQFDCVNGFDITGSLDTPHITRCHAWPFGTVGASAPVTTFGTGHYLFRNGTAYKLTSCVDWAKLTDNFAFGYLRGFDIVDSPNTTLLSCGSDGVSNAGPDYAITGTRSFSVSGTSKDVAMLGCQAAAQEYGYYVNLTNEADSALIEGCSAWYIKSAAVNLTKGSPIIRGNSFRSALAGLGIGIANASANNEPIIDGNIIDGFGDAIHGISNYTRAVIGKNRIINCTNNSTSVGVFQVASAATLPVGPLRDVYEVTGTTTVTALPATYPGHIVDLRFTGAVPFTHNGTSLILPDARNLTTAAGDALRFVNIGGANWRCVGYVEASTAWKSYTPSLSPASGTFTSASASGKYRVIGKTCHFKIVVTVTTLGSAGGGYILIGLPMTAAGDAICVGRGTLVSGKMVTATIVATATTAPVVNYDNTFPVASGESIILNGTYEV